MYAHVLVEGNPDNAHPPSSEVSRHSHETQGRRGINVVGINDIHVRTDENADTAETEEA